MKTNKFSILKTGERSKKKIKGLTPKERAYQRYAGMHNKKRKEQGLI